ncbi:uncharacterized protein [Asterias amurensis]|uniref:uncharacterized protein n=1 Tax=Asterias amurensis TaxID=7602 RepID=UPI003AB8C38F
MGKFGIVFKGALVRALFSLHAGVSVWLISKDNEIYLLMWLLFLLFIFFEGVFTTKVKKHGTWKWFSPTVCLFLLCSVPCLWKLELESFETRKDVFMDPNNTCNTSTFPLISLPPLFGFRVPVVSDLHLSLQDWTLVLHQTLLFMLILGRWLLPKGDLSRDQLSQLLLVQIGMAADILEFVTEGLKAEIMVYGIYTYVQVLIILTVWTWSLPQFTLSLTLTKSRKPRVAGTGSILREQPHVDHRGNFGVCHLFCGTEVWAILVTMTMQDLPFLGTRLYLIFNPEIPISIPFLFFTFKNALLTMLQLYRLSVILQEYRHQRMARVRVTPEHHPPSIIDLEDVEPVDEPQESLPKHPGPQQQPSTTPWFASRFLSGFVGPKLRQRKHVSIQTEQSLQIVASISSHWAVDVDDEGEYLYQYADTDAKPTAKARDARSPAPPNDARSPTPAGGVPKHPQYRRNPSRTFSETPRSPSPKCEVIIESPNEDKKDELTVIFNKKHDRGVKEEPNTARVASTEKRSETPRDVNPKAEGRYRVEDSVASVRGELVNDAINDIISDFEDWSGSDSQLQSRDDKS